MRYLMSVTILSQLTMMDIINMIFLAFRFYISDIHLVHKVCNMFKDKATKEEIRSYIKFLVNELVESIEIKPANSYLLIAGDTSSIFEFTKIFTMSLFVYGIQTI